MKGFFLKKHLILGAMAGLIVLGFSGCSDHTKVKSFNGIFVDNVVVGADWKCDGKSGVTDKNGVFGPCPKGSTVTFKVGNIILGKSQETSDHIFTPFDLAGTKRDKTDDPKVKRIVSFLLSVDIDNNPENKIVITSTVKKVLEEKVQTVAKEENVDHDVIDLTQVKEDIVEKVVVKAIEEVAQEVEKDPTLQTKIKEEAQKEAKIKPSKVKIKVKKPNSEEVIKHIEELPTIIDEVEPPVQPDQATD